jgi:hypothetical protein
VLERAVAARTRLEAMLMDSFTADLKAGTTTEE